MRAALRAVLLAGTSTGLDLNFAGGVFSLNNTRTSNPAAIPGWSFSRTDTNGTATALDLAGNVIQFATGVPRITNRGLLVEEARTNLLLWSQTFDNASWIKTACTVTANQAIAPDGSLTADLVTDNSTSGTSLEQSVTVSSGAICTASRFIKYDDVPWIRFVIGDGVNFIRVWFNVQTGTVGTIVAAGTGGNASATITPAANGFYRCTVTGSLTGVTSYAFFTTTATADASVTRVSGGKRLEWGAQLEAGAFATSPIITTGAAGTRGADLPILTPVAFSQPFTVAAEWDLPLTASQSIQTIAYWTNATGYIRRIRAGSSETAFQLINDANVLDLNLNVAGATAAGVGRASLRAQTNDARPAVNSALLSLDTSCDIATMTIVRVGTNGAAEQLNGYVRRIRVLPFAATDAQLQALTAP
jgi:hypothetical protein